MAKSLTVYGIYHDKCAEEIINRSTVISPCQLTASQKAELERGQFNKCWYCNQIIKEGE